MRTRSIQGRNIQGRNPADLTGRYSLTTGVRLVDRGPLRLQVGVEPPRCVIVEQAIPGTAALLSDLDGRTPLAEVLERHSADPTHWSEVIGGLLAHGLVTRGSSPTESSGPVRHPIPEQAALTHRHGPPAVDRLLQTRTDALVVVRGTGRVASAVAGLLAGSGVGHVFQQPDRAVRSGDLFPELTWCGGPPLGAPSPPGANDVLTLQTRLRQLAPHVRVQRPASQIPPSLTVLAGDGPPDPAVAAQLSQAGHPHLAAWAGIDRAVVGPLVLPGRTSCLLCADLTRAELDPDWPAIAAAMRREYTVPPAILAAGTAALAAREVLEFLEGEQEPATFDGSLEWTGSTLPRRRSRLRHPDCGCFLVRSL